MLKDWIQGRVSVTTYQEINDSLLGSQHRFTRLMNTPESATLADLLRLAYQLEVHPLQLIDDFGFGRRNVTDEDRAILSRHYTLTPQDSQTIKPHEYPTHPGDQPAGYPGKPARRAAGQSPRGEPILP